MKSTIPIITTFLAYLSSTAQAQDVDVAVRLMYSQGYCHDYEWEALGLGDGQRRNLRERELCSVSRWCNKKCRGYRPGKCHVVYPQCDPCRRRTMDTGRKLDFFSACDVALAGINAGIDSGYDSVLTACQERVNSRTHKCFTMHEGSNTNPDDIHHFELWNANANPGTVVDEDLVDMDSFCENGFLFSIEAVAGNEVDDVEFELYGPGDFNYAHTEFHAPYTLFANQGNNVNGQFYEAGIYDLFATPDGRPEKARALRFEIKESTHPDCIGHIPWIEDFDLNNGAQSDTGSTAWTATPGSGMSLEVENGALVLNNGNSAGVVTTGIIDIADSTVSVSLDLYSVGPLEDYQDFVRLYKKVDGGSEQLIGEQVGILDNGTTITGSGITGNTLELVIRAYVSYPNEFYYMDNLSVLPEY